MALDGIMLNEQSDRESQIPHHLTYKLKTHKPQTELIDTDSSLGRWGVGSGKMGEGVKVRSRGDKINKPGT